MEGSGGDMLGEAPWYIVWGFEEPSGSISLLFVVRRLVKTNLFVSA